jgi:hypothetical protein
LNEVEQAVALARDSVGDTRRLMLASARSELGAIDERFQVPGLNAERTMLRQIDRVLAEVRFGNSDVSAWHKEWPRVRAALLQAEPRSLYAPTRLRLFVRSAGVS